MQLFKLNRHWEPGYRYPFEKKRAAFESLKAQLGKKQIVELSGLRRTGKTTLFFQLINHLLDTGTDPFSILYFTFDEDHTTIDDLLAAFQKQTGKELKMDRLFIFLDEVQKLNNFQNQIKIYYDLYPNLKFFLSGSTSLFIKKRTQESLAGRLKSIFLPPLSFSEYLYFKEKEAMLSRLEMYQTEIEIEFELYWNCQFIETIDMPPSDRKEYLLSILKKMVYEDVPVVFSVENPSLLLRLLKVTAQHPGMLLHYQNLGNDLGLSAKTISKYVHILSESFLVNILFNYSPNLLTSEKKMKRLYLSSSSFIGVFADSVEKGKIAENVYLTSAQPKFFWRDVYKHEVDFINTSTEPPVPVEIKYTSSVRDRDFQNLFLFCRKYSLPKAQLCMKRFDRQVVTYKGLDVELVSIFKA